MNLDNRNAMTEDIIVYENFLTKEESDNLIRVLDKQAESSKISWMPISFYESYSSVLPQDGDPELEEFNLPSTFLSDIKAKIIEAVASIKNLDPKQIVEIGYHTQKWEPGAYARKHSDNTDEHGNTGPFERSRYAGFIYLNDNFDGGLLRFPDQNIEIQPKAGTLAVFDGGHKNMHEVSLITKGVRYTIGSFWDDREESDYPQEVRDAWAEEMKKIREQQKVEKEEWQKVFQEGYKIDQQGKKYKIEELN